MFFPRCFASHVLLAGSLFLTTIVAAQSAGDRTPEPTPLESERVASGPAVIGCQNGNLTMEEWNDKWSTIIEVRCDEGGIVIDLPAGADQRIVGVLGGGRTRDEIDSLLGGMHLSYATLQAITDPNRLSQIILTPRSMQEALARRGAPEGTSTNGVSQVAVISEPRSPQPATAQNNRLPSGRGAVPVVGRRPNADQEPTQAADLVANAGPVDEASAASTAASSTAGDQADGSPQTHRHRRRR